MACDFENAGKAVMMALVGTFCKQLTKITCNNHGSAKSKTQRIAKLAVDNPSGSVYFTFVLAYIAQYSNILE